MFLLGCLSKPSINDQTKSLCYFVLGGFPPQKKELKTYAMPAMRRQLLKNCGKVEVLQVIFGYGIAGSPMTDLLLLGIPLLINDLLTCKAQEVIPRQWM